MRLFLTLGTHNLRSPKSLEQPCPGEIKEPVADGSQLFFLLILVESNGGLRLSGTGGEGVGGDAGGDGGDYRGGCADELNDL